MNKMYLGKCVNTHGIKGEFRIKSDIEQKNLIFTPGNIIYINDEPLEIITYRVHKDYDMVTVKGYNDIEQVIPFKGQNVFFDRDQINITGYLLSDLIGFDVMFNDKIVGKITDYQYNSSNCLLVINNEKYIPNQPYFIKRVDLLEQKVFVENVEEILK